MDLTRRIWMLAVLVAGLGMVRPSADASETDRDAATRARVTRHESAARVPVPEPSEKALRYYRTGNWLWVVAQVWGLAIPAAVILSGLSVRMRNVARAIGRRWFFVVGIYVILYLLLDYLAGWPLAYYAGHVRPHAYGLSNRSFTDWQVDGLKALAVSMVMGFLFVWVPYRLIALSPRRWWLWTGLLTLPFTFFMALLAPIVFDPLFNDFGPMRDKQLEARILSLADRATIQDSRVFEVDKSKDTEAVNAYVTGFLTTKRIVLWDTLVNKLEDREVLAVMGHEMGHYVLGHVTRGLLLSSLLTLIGLYIVHQIARRLVSDGGNRFRIEGLADVASLPVLILLGQLMNLSAAPVINLYSRHVEHEADRFALEITRDNHAAAMAFVRLQRENLGNPRPGLFYTLFRASHPSLGDRIDFCNDYRPWQTGQPLRYKHLFEQPEKPSGTGAEPIAAEDSSRRNDQGP